MESSRHPARFNEAVAIPRRLCALGAALILVASSLTLARAGHADEPQAAADERVRAILAPLAAADRDARRAAAVEMGKLGERAVPELIRARRSTSPAVARWATGQLEAMNRRVPGDCVQTKDMAVLADVLRAFGEIRDPDAVGVVLSFVNADRDAIRTAARGAIGAYGEGALGKLREAYASLAGKPAPVEWGAGEAARALFAIDDDLRLQDVRQLVDKGLQQQRDGDLAGAVESFDKALARQPDLERRADLAPAYVMRALEIEESDRPGALAYLRKATMLAPDGPRAAQANSELAFLEAQDLRARGVVDVELLRRATTLDPTNVRARAVLDQIEGDSADRKRRIRTASEVGGAVALVLVGLVLFVGRRRR
jgi:tetratricopeptide (TPR) repeat protein